jgi:hypothetical protein
MTKKKADELPATRILDYPESMSCMTRKPCGGSAIGRREENKETTQARR